VPVARSSNERKDSTSRPPMLLVLASVLQIFSCVYLMDVVQWLRTKFRSASYKKRRRVPSCKFDLYWTQFSSNSMTSECDRIRSRDSVRLLYLNEFPCRSLVNNFFAHFTGSGTKTQPARLNARLLWLNSTHGGDVASVNEKLDDVRPITLEMDGRVGQWRALE
jgi:hypothetical protein